ncbi:uncharacterized protein LOC126810776 [Patella vulgata]|uniref:uncharacterized protein LOC126810776 n=1 Tax=Patella vulgata TaxID=6465 RepID=UPI00217F5B29|nr:uncharacterized protein LOC126810776 [Patella vulgata]
MSGPNKSYLPSQRMMPSFTTVSPKSDDGKTSEYNYDLAESSKATSPALSSPYSRIQESPKTVAELAYSRMQEFPYGISGVPMPSYNYNSELYNYVSNGFPRKSRMCSYCGKVFTRSTTRRYHEKRCPLLRAAGSLLNNTATTEDQRKNEVKTFSSNTSFPVVSVAPQTSYYGAFPSSLYSTSAGLDQNRNHALTGMKIEPQERKDRTDGRDIRDHNLDRPSSRLMSDMENVARPMFSPANIPSPESLASRGRSSPSPVGDEGDSQVDGETLKTSADHIINTSKDVFHAKYEQMSGLQAVRSASYSHSGTIYAAGTEKDGSPHDGILTDTGQDQFPTNRELGERKRKTEMRESVVGNGDDDEFSGITQGYKEDNELGEITPKKNISDKQCGLCGQLFDNIEELEAHEQLHTNYKPYACRFCGERFAKVSMRITHERVHIGEKPYVCAICGLTFTRKYSVRIHMRRKHVDGACLCRYCGKTLFDLQSLKDHLLSHDLPKAEKDSLNYLNTNPGEKNDDDLDSNEGSMSSDNNDEETNGVTDAPILEAEATSKSKDKEWCRLCEKDIPKSFLRYHERMHADQKPFECPLCKKRFGYKNNMKSHMKLHAGIKPYQCHICGAKFTRGSTLRRHARRHGIVTDSVWDFFTQKQGKSAGSLDQSPSAGRPKVGGASPDVSSTRPGGSESSIMLPDSSHNYDLASMAAASNAANALYASYGSLPHGLYPPYSTTSLLQYAGYNTTTPLVQSDALNLTVHSPHLTSKIKLLANQMEDNNIQKADAESDEISRKSDSPSDVKPGCRNMGVQVKSCCQADAKGLLDASYDLRMLSPSSFESSGSVATSPSLSSGTETLMNETLSSLLSSGKMFRCSHCCSFFAEYAMYRIHQKLHAKDAAHPFMCPQCGEDCQDRMYFSLHLAEHLK